jgi:hypothetical protein
MSYIGRDVNYGNAATDHFTGSGGATYALTYDSSTSGVVVSLDGVVQKNGTDFNITGTSLVFTSVVASPIAIQVIYTGLTLSIGTPADGTVTDAKITAMAASKLSGALPAISGAALTNLPSEITKSSSDPTIATNPAGGVGTVFLNTTSGEMFSLTDATAGANVWTNIGDGTGRVPFIGMVGTGGTITTDGDYKVHVFNSSSSFTVTTLGDLGTVEYLVISGGGGGGSQYFGAGGGAGGYLTATGFSVSAQTYSIAVGGGGAGGPSGSTSQGTDGSVSTFSSFSPVAGGGGGGYNGNMDGRLGGSGGGSGQYLGTIGTAGSGTGGQGYDGAQGYGTGAHPVGTGGGGGGGAGAAAPDRTGVTSPSTGGAGASSSITGSAVTRAGGGGGGIKTPSVSTAGGTGGGGAGGYDNSAAVAGTTNTGSGGGGADNNTGTAAGGGIGGSGVVIIRYKFQ